MPVNLKIWGILFSFVLFSRELLALQVQIPSECGRSLLATGEEIALQVEGVETLDPVAQLRISKYAPMKRALDLVFVSISLPVTLPAMAITAMMVKLSSGGPVFFIQNRVGKDGKIFRIFKFRTMYVGSEVGGAKLVTKNDPRVTRIGFFLRRSHLDELPQILNVLKGEMSLIGPRPFEANADRHLRETLPGYALRAAVLPGMGGLAQVKGGYGYSQNIEGALEADIQYVKTTGLLTDLRLLYKSLCISFGLRGR